MSIPKKIHYCWFGEGEIPERDQKCIESWKKFCPDYEIIQWNENNYDVAQIPYMKEAYGARRWGFVSDFARMDIVYKHGGIYMDTDVELLQPLDELLNYSGYIGIEAGSSCVSFGLGFGAEPGLEILKELCDYYRTLSFLNEDGSLNLKPNPLIVTEYLQKRKGMRLEPDKVQNFEGFTILPAEYLCPQNFETGKINLTDKAFSIHHYHASWLTEKERESLKEYRRYTKLFGNHLGELMYQGVKNLCNKGVLTTLKKVIGYFKRG